MAYETIENLEKAHVELSNTLFVQAVAEACEVEFMRAQASKFLAVSPQGTRLISSGSVTAAIFALKSSTVVMCH